MAVNIDWPFIGTLEGDATRGYVPDPVGSDSGVTIADGVDLGQQTVASLAGLPLALRIKLSPYLGLRRQDAVRTLAGHPLTLTAAEVDTLNAHIHAEDTDLLVSRYNGASSVPFAQVPDLAQTVIASVSFQYGDLAKRCPKFWGCAIRQDWTGLHAELLNFGDAYGTRRRKEAAYMKPLLPARA